MLYDENKVILRVFVFFFFKQTMDKGKRFFCGYVLIQTQIAESHKTTQFKKIIVQNFQLET